MKQFIWITATLSIVSTAVGSAAIVVPAYLDAASNPDTFNSASTMVDGSGLDAPANAANGVDLATALSVTHNYNGNYQQSWVTNDPAPGGGDYFADATANPTVVFDLGADLSIGTVILWQYQNNGGGNPGNHAQTVELRFNTDAEGTSFGGAADLTVTMIDVPNLPGGINSAQDYAAGGITARYVEVMPTDNYFGSYPAGGDRVGLGEIRFDIIPEPSTSLLGGLGFLALLRRRR